MRKLQKAAVVAVALGTVGFLGAGTAVAHSGGSGGKSSHGYQGSHGKGGGYDKDEKANFNFTVPQVQDCDAGDDINIAALNNIGVLNGLLGGALKGGDNAGAQSFTQGDDFVSCVNKAFNQEK